MLRKTKIALCLGSSCFARGNEVLIPLIKKFITRHNLEDKVEFKGDHCFNNCSKGPNLFIGNRLFEQVNESNIVSILEEGLSDILTKY